MLTLVMTVVGRDKQREDIGERVENKRVVVVIKLDVSWMLVVVAQRA